MTKGILGVYENNKTRISHRIYPVSPKPLLNVDISIVSKDCVNGRRMPISLPYCVRPVWAFAVPVYPKDTFSPGGTSIINVNRHRVYGQHVVYLTDISQLCHVSKLHVAIVCISLLYAFCVFMTLHRAIKLGAVVQN